MLICLLIEKIANTVSETDFGTFMFFAIVIVTRVRECKLQGLTLFALRAIPCPSLPDLHNYNNYLILCICQLSNLCRIVYYSYKLCSNVKIFFYCLQKQEKKEISTLEKRENDYEGGLFSIHIQEAIGEYSAVPELLQ